MFQFFNISYCSDKYQYTMGKTFYDQNIHNKKAVFNLFYRSAPDKNNWAVVSGIEEALEMIRGLGTESESFFEKFLPGEQYKEYRVFLSNMKFTGDVYAMKEGEIAFPSQPVIIVEGPLIEAQVLETPLLSIMNHQMAIATKASRVSRATAKPISEFGSRRAHGPWAAAYGAKAAYIGGCLNSSNIITNNKFGIPVSGTMAHSYINAFGCNIAGELKAFDAYIKSHWGEPLILLVDTYDTLRCGIKNAIQAYKDNGVDNSYPQSYGIRLDSGDLTYLSNACREELDQAGLTQCKIFATNSLDEYIITELERQGAKIDAYGVGDAIATSKHNPCFGNVYKLVEIDGEPVLKRSEDKSKAINPGFQVTYRISKNGFFKVDVTCLKGDSLSRQIETNQTISLRAEFDDTKSTTFPANTYQHQVLQSKVISKGEIIQDTRSLKERRDYYLENLDAFNPTQTRLINPHFYKVDISDNLYDLKNKLINSLIEEIKKLNENE
ncbi:MAG: nicotinate phosphoribosyltransferase [Bacteroidia bacterium]|nr:nicotinate phosphoribosyltransferase [Bacteroidia bacterium]